MLYLEKKNIYIYIYIYKNNDNLETVYQYWLILKYFISLIKPKRPLVRYWLPKNVVHFIEREIWIALLYACNNWIMLLLSFFGCFKFLLTFWRVEKKAHLPKNAVEDRVHRYLWFVLGIVSRTVLSCGSFTEAFA